MSTRFVPAAGIVVAHGRLAAELRATAEAIAGPAGDLVCLSNSGLSPEDLVREIAMALDGAGPFTVVMADLAGGSCLAAALRAARGRPGVEVVAGVNLPLLLDFLHRRAELTGKELVDHILDRGRAGISRAGAV